MALRTIPDFKLIRPNPNPTLITNAEWWLWERCHELEPSSKLGGIYADKKGFHNTADRNAQKWPDNYSIRHARNRAAPGKTHARAFDWTFPDAQAGDFKTIDKYTSRLLASALNPGDPRLDLVLFEFYGNADRDKEVEGYNEHTEEHVSSDPSHTWHLHESFWGDECGDFWGMYALHTVHMGWNVAQWRAKLPAAPKPVPPRPLPAGLPQFRNGARELSVKSPAMRGSDVLYVEMWIGPKWCGPADGTFTAQTREGVKRYQEMRGFTKKQQDGIVGPQTWREMGIR